jgi:hypothetical protein
VTAPDAPLVFSADQAEVNEQTTAYGLATWHDRRARAAWALVSQRHRRVVAKARLVADGGRAAAGRGHGRRHQGQGPVRGPGGRRRLRMGVDLGRTRPTLVDPSVGDPRR